MCTEEKFHALERRVERMDDRLRAVEATVTAGFGDLKSELGRLYAERAKWSEWMRENIGHVLKWAGVIILSACGINQATGIVRLFVGGAT